MQFRKFLLKKTPLLYRILRWLYRLPGNYWKPDEGDLCRLLERFCQRLNRPITFVQVGANDGNDEFALLRRRYHWTGVMVEPQRRVYEQLAKSNCEPGIIFEMTAIGTHDGVQTLYEISFSKAKWATELASFDYDVIWKHINNGYIVECARKDGLPLPVRSEDYCTKKSVPCLTLKSLIEKHHLDSLDVLLVDTEGYDSEIVKQIIQLPHPPRLVFFEHKHLSKPDYLACINMLRGLKYELQADSCNCIGVRQ